MSRTVRLVMFAVAGSMVGAMLVLAILKLPLFGASRHPYRTHAVVAAVAHNTANVVSSVNFDLRGLDTLGEESILLASVMCVAVLLRPAKDEVEGDDGLSPGRILDLTSLGGYVLLPVTMIIGFDVIAHGHLTPGGGFQGGVILGTGWHLLYVAGRYRTLRRLSPEGPFRWGEAFAAAAFACVGITGLIVSGAFLANFLPTATFGQLFSAGTVPLLNGVVGIEVASGTMVLLAKFLQQVVLVEQEKGASS
jgi:multicomponent Na+:H+ antiporter subunit B